MAHDVFLSYRHGDAVHVRALQSALREHLGAGVIARDLEAMHGGDDLRAAIPEMLARCDVVLAVVGPSWRTEEPDGLVLERSDDWVRFEISLALAWRKRILPVLVGDASMPSRRQLPRDVEAFADHVAVAVRDSDWEHDIARLVELVDPDGRTRPGSDHRPSISDTGPVAGGDISIVGDVVAGRDLTLGEDGG